MSKELRVVVERGDRQNIISDNLSPKQKPSYLNLKIKVRLSELLAQAQVPAELINDAIDHIDLGPFIRIDNEDQLLLLVNIIKYQLIVRGVDITGFVQNELYKALKEN